MSHVLPSAFNEPCLSDSLMTIQVANTKLFDTLGCPSKEDISKANGPVDFLIPIKLLNIKYNSFRILGSKFCHHKNRGQNIVQNIMLQNFCLKFICKTILWKTMYIFRYMP